MENGKVISDGSNNVVVGYALPGLKESLNVKDDDFDGDVTIPDYVEVKAKVENFKLVLADGQAQGVAYVIHISVRIF